MYQPETHMGIGGGRITNAVKNLIIANGAVFLLQMLMNRFPEFNYIKIFGLVPAQAVTQFNIWQFVTYMFLHANLWHILINMFVLWMFGCEVERMWGPKAFYKYYFITGIGAGIISILVRYITGGDPSIATVGASGAVMGVLAAFAVMFPNRVVTLLLMFVIPVRMKAKTLVLIFAGISLLSGIGGGDGIAHFAHLGGMAVGYLYMKRGSLFKNLSQRFGSTDNQRRMRVVRRKQEELDKLRRLLDQVLDKANEVGMENLTKDEKLFLKRASKILNKEKPTS
jgi:membrane associated rhomboid family serine protease